ncbi:hypothetical protein B0H16DRAFT_1769603 [Mycena metata]|uniref:Uncharacterized protein n=1 Tax=Mycena metata TaxID=1033252 RepID=A0AAD7I1W4_9AGAR|nr:hypothetical protein B0H16DRAFT_1769603 [Mycena metata]
MRVTRAVLQSAFPREHARWVVDGPRARAPEAGASRLFPPLWRGYDASSPLRAMSIRRSLGFCMLMRGGYSNRPRTRPVSILSSPYCRRAALLALYSSSTLYFFFYIYICARVPLSPFIYAVSGFTDPFLCSPASTLSGTFPSYSSTSRSRSMTRLGRAPSLTDFLYPAAVFLRRAHPTYARGSAPRAFGLPALGEDVIARDLRVVVATSLGPRSPPFGRRCESARRGDISFLYFLFSRARASTREVVIGGRGAGAEGGSGGLERPVGAAVVVQHDRRAVGWDRHWWMIDDGRERQATRSAALRSTSALGHDLPRDVCTRAMGRGHRRTHCRSDRGTAREGGIYAPTSLLLSFLHDGDGVCEGAASVLVERGRDYGQSIERKGGKWRAVPADTPFG